MKQPGDRAQSDVDSAMADLLAQRIDNLEARIGIIGLGYVGLPLSIAFASAGFQVLGFDVDREKVRRLQSGETYIDHLDESEISQLVSEGKLQATADFDRLGEPDVLLICVPTPLTAHREPDLRYVVETAKQIATTLRSGQLVILESTTYPGTTDELVREILEESGLSCGQDFFLAYSPEREDPGNPDFSTTRIPKVVGGVDRRSGRLASSLYEKVVAEVVPVESARVAEAAKLTENIFRAINIALVNELKMVYDAMGIDIWEVLDAADTKPFGFMRFNPGPGWGGHCIPLDPFYLTWKSREYGVSPRFIELAGEINAQMPRFVIRKLQEALNVREKSVRGSKILLLGLAYKKDIADPRESPAFEILHQLLTLGADVSYHDPHIATAPKMRTWPGLPQLHSLPLDQKVLANSDAAIIVTDHTDVDYDLVLEHTPLIVDARGVYRDEHRHVVKA